MVGSLKRQMEDLHDRSLVINDEVKRMLRLESWSPIMGAMLLSGIRPSARWVDVPPAKGHRDDVRISHRNLFVELLSASSAPERGIDNEPVLRSSHRFKCAENILHFWDEVCGAHNDYPIDLPPRDFVGWLWSMNRKGYVHILDSMWLEAFANNYSPKHFNKVLPKEVLAWLTQSAKKASIPSPKHKFGREIAMARFEAKQAGDPSDDPDEILSRLAEMMQGSRIRGVKLLRYSPKSDIQYQFEGVRGTHTLRRDSFARQLRRMTAKEQSSADASISPAPSDGNGPFFKPVAVKADDINRFTSNEQLTTMALDLLAETIAYVRLAARLEHSDAGWPRETAVLVGNVVRLSKLLTSIHSLTILKQTETLALTVPLAIGTMVDLKYLIENRDARLIDSYMGIPAKKRSKAGIDWACLDLKQKADATGLSGVYVDALQDAPSHLHGSWKDLTEFHLTAVGDERYRAKHTWTELNPLALLTTSVYALVVIHGFSSVIASGPLMEKLQNGVDDLYGRLKIAHEAFYKSLYTRW